MPESNNMPIKQHPTITIIRSNRPSVRPVILYSTIINQDKTSDLDIFFFFLFSFGCMLYEEWHKTCKNCKTRFGINYVASIRNKENKYKELENSRGISRIIKELKKTKSNEIKRN